jgi:hypothetical protein
MDRIRQTSPDRWIDLIFSAQAAKGGVVRPSIAWVAAEVGQDLFEAEVRRRGYHLLIAGNQYVVVCNNGPIRILF